MKPQVAIIDPNVLLVIGLTKSLESVMPIMEVVSYASLSQFLEDNPDRFLHYFVPVSVFLSGKQFFMERARKTIVLTVSEEQSRQINGLNTLCVGVSEQEFLQSLLRLRQKGHAHGEHLPMDSKMRKGLTTREAEVLVKVAQGYLNKEIADLLHISITTVISHRKNITEKLGIKSVSGLTVYAVMNGYIDINNI